MGSVNKVILVGNLGRDAELRYTPGGAAVATLNLATTETWKDKEGQKKEDTQWHRVILWGKTAETLQDYLTKGKQIYVEGKLQTRKWKDKDGNENTPRKSRATAWSCSAAAAARAVKERRAPEPEHQQQQRQPRRWHESGRGAGLRGAH